MNTIRITIGILLAISVTGVSAQEYSRWYWRADIGFAISENADIKDKTQDPAGVTSFANLCDGSGSCSFNLDDVGNSPAFSLGAGYQFNNNFRADFTGTYRSDFELDDSIASTFGGNDTHKSDIEVLTVMVTGYYDFPSQNSMFKPYIGGGIGISRNKMGKTTVTNPVGGLTRTHSGSTENDMAWQLVFGLTSPMKNNKSLDISYKYVDAGNIDSGSSSVSGNAGGPFGPLPFDGVKGDMVFHEVTIGLRF